MPGGQLLLHFSTSSAVVIRSPMAELVAVWGLLLSSYMAARVQSWRQRTGDEVGFKDAEVGRFSRVSSYLMDEVTCPEASPAELCVCQRNLQNGLATTIEGYFVSSLKMGTR